MVSHEFDGVDHLSIGKCPRIPAANAKAIGCWRCRDMVVELDRGRGSGGVDGGGGVSRVVGAGVGAGQHCYRVR